MKELEYLFNIAKNRKNKEENLEKYKEIINIFFQIILCLNSMDERNAKDFEKKNKLSEVKVIKNFNYR